jgi:hypothetical protein
MIYSNREIEVVEQEFDFGKIKQVCVGERGRGRKQICLTAPNDLKVLSQGLNESLTIGKTKTGKPKIIKEKDDQVFLLISTKGGYTRRGNGRLYSLKTNNIEILAVGNGADGDAGRIGSWTVALLEVKGNGVFRIKKGGGNPSTLLVVKDGKVYEFEPMYLDEFLEAHGELPSFEFDYSELVFNTEEWDEV